jgi:hypothetical protein
MSAKMGRPRVPKAEKRDIFVVTRVSPEENKLFMAAIKLSKQSKSDWARKALLHVANNPIDFS